VDIDVLEDVDAGPLILEERDDNISVRDLSGQRDTGRLAIVERAQGAVDNQPLAQLRRKTLLRDRTAARPALWSRSKRAMTTNLGSSAAPEFRLKIAIVYSPAQYSTSGPTRAWNRRPSAGLVAATTPLSKYSTTSGVRSVESTSTRTGSSVRLIT
jgi:hypothetical protein